jgi:excisionase family DNA binding protein
MAEKLIGLRDAAKMLGISRSRCYQLVQEGRLPVIQIGGDGGRMQFRAKDIEAQLQPKLRPQPAQKLDILDLIIQAGISPDELVAMLKAAHKAFLDSRMKAEMQTLGLLPTQEPAKEAKSRG